MKKLLFILLVNYSLSYAAPSSERIICQYVDHQGNRVNFTSNLSKPGSFSKDFFNLNHLKAADFVEIQNNCKAHNPSTPNHKFAFSGLKVQNKNLIQNKNLKLYDVNIENSINSIVQSSPVWNPQSSSIHAPEILAQAMTQYQLPNDESYAIKQSISHGSTYVIYFEDKQIIVDDVINKVEDSAELRTELTLKIRNLDRKNIPLDSAMPVAEFIARFSNERGLSASILRTLTASNNIEYIFQASEANPQSIKTIVKYVLEPKNDKNKSFIIRADTMYLFDGIQYHNGETDEHPFVIMTTQRFWIDPIHNKPYQFIPIHTSKHFYEDFTVVGADPRVEAAIKMAFLNEDLPIYKGNNNSWNYNLEEIKHPHKNLIAPWKWPWQ